MFLCICFASAYYQQEIFHSSYWYGDVSGGVEGIERSFQRRWFEKWKQLYHVKRTLSVLSEVSVQDQNTARIVFECLFRSIKVLGRQGMPLRAHSHCDRVLWHSCWREHLHYQKLENFTKRKLDVRYNPKQNTWNVCSCHTARDSLWNSTLFIWT